jgi:hypothetical protein
LTWFYLCFPQVQSSHALSQSITLIRADHKLSEQVERFRELSSLTNTIPLLGKTDLLDADVISNLKTSILKELQSSGAKPFFFGKSFQEILGATSTASANIEDSTANLCEAPALETTESTRTEVPQTPQAQSSTTALPPFAISTLPGSDDSEMDASLLMSPSYIPPPIPSEFQVLLSQIFDPEHIAWLRHSAARKFLTWRDRRRSEEGISGGGDSMVMHGGAMVIQKPAVSTTQGPLITRPAQSSSALSPFNLSSAAVLGSGLSDFTRARLRDHTLREETLAQMQLTKWASDLQYTLQHERDQYEALVKGERAKWLLERVGEEVRLGNIGSLDTDGIVSRLPVLDRSSSNGGNSSRSSSNWSLSKSSRKSRREGELPSWSRPKRKTKGRLDPQDPLGLCDLGDNMRRTTNTVLKVVGGSMVVTAAYFAVIGAIHRLNGTDPEPMEGWAPRWLSALIGRVIWPDEPQMWV